MERRSAGEDSRTQTHRWRWEKNNWETLTGKRGGKMIQNDRE